MAITKSAKKALRQNKKRRAQNIDRKDSLKDILKEIKALVAAKKLDEAKKLLPRIYKTLDKVAKVGVIKKNAASRKKSRIAKLIAKSAKAQ